MSGFLQRLASQAMGSTNTLHSAMRQPFSETSLPIYAEVPDRQAATSSPSDNALNTSARSDAEVMPATNQNIQRISSPADIGAQHHEYLDTQSLPEILIPHIELSAKQDRPQVPRASAKSTLRQSNADVRETVSDKSQVVFDSVETHTSENNTATRVIDHHRQYSTQPDSDSSTGSFVQDKEDVTHPDSVSPPLLLPPKNAARFPAFNTGAVAQRGIPRDSALQAHIEETTEVHVSIGRIEVTAVHEAPPPKRQAPTSAKPMSLDEYLARRKKEA